MRSPAALPDGLLACLFVTVVCLACSDVTVPRELFVAGETQQIVPLSGTVQCTQEGHAFGDTIVLRVTDEFGNATPGVVISVDVANGLVDGKAATQQFTSGPSGTFSFTATANLLPASTYDGSVALAVRTERAHLELNDLRMTKVAFLKLFSSPTLQATCCNDPFGYAIRAQALGLCYTPIPGLEISYFCGQSHCTPLSGFTDANGFVADWIGWQFCGGSDLTIRALDIMRGVVPNSVSVTVFPPSKCCQRHPTDSSRCIPCNVSQPDERCGT